MCCTGHAAHTWSRCLIQAASQILSKKQGNQTPRDSRFKTTERYRYLNTRHRATRALAPPLLFKSKPVFKYLILPARWKKPEQSEVWFPFPSPTLQQLLADLLSIHRHRRAAPRSTAPLWAATRDPSEPSETRRQSEFQANNYLLIILPGPTLWENVLIPQAMFSQNHQGSEKVGFISQVLTLRRISFENGKWEYLLSSRKKIFSYFTFVIQIKLDKCLTAVPTESSSIYDLLSTKASQRHGLLLRTRSMPGGEVFINSNESSFKNKKKTKLSTE